jgi:hypothetical protein
MKKLLLFLTLLGFLALTPSIGFGQKRSSSKSYKKSYKPKTVRVKSYTTKKGKHVKSYRRSKPSKRRHAYILIEAVEPKRIAA